MGYLPVGETAPATEKRCRPHCEDGKFPDGEIAHNKALRRQGIICAKEEEMRLWKKRNPQAASAGRRPDTCPESGCDGCAFFETER